MSDKINLLEMAQKENEALSLIKEQVAQANLRLATARRLNQKALKEALNAVPKARKSRLIAIKAQYEQEMADAEDTIQAELEELLGRPVSFKDNILAVTDVVAEKSEVTAGSIGEKVGFAINGGVRTAHSFLDRLKKEATKGITAKRRR